MSIKTILENLFGRVMKNGKRIPGSRVMVFGTRIFFEDYLLPEDIIICTDYADFLSLRRRGKYKHIWFLSEAKVKSLAILDSEGNPSGKLYNCIVRKFEMKHFDMTITNPPYDGDLHLKIIKELVEHSDTVVAIHPARWLEDVLAEYKSGGAVGKRFHSLKVALEQAYLFKPCEIKKMFHIGLDQDALIGVYKKDSEDIDPPIYKVPVNMFFGVFHKVIEYAKNVNSIDKKCDEQAIDGIRVEVKGISPRSHDGDGCMSELARNSFVTLTGNRPFIDGKNEKGELWHKADGKRQNQYTRNKTFKLFPLSIKFDSMEEAWDFIKLYNTTVVKNIVHMLKYDMNACHTFIPYVDVKKIKTEDEFLDEIGITDKESREWLKRDVTDYRVKDFINYGKWIDC